MADVDPKCVFCQRFERGEFDEVTSAVASFEALNPVAPGHRLFMPFLHTVDAGHAPIITGVVMQAASHWGRIMGADFNLITSAGEHATQTIRHLHIHYVPRVAGDGLHLPWTGQEVARG